MAADHALFHIGTGLVEIAAGFVLDLDRLPPHLCQDLSSQPRPCLLP